MIQLGSKTTAKIRDSWDHKHNCYRFSALRPASRNREYKGCRISQKAFHSWSTGTGVVRGVPGLYHAPQLELLSNHAGPCTEPTSSWFMGVLRVVSATRYDMLVAVAGGRKPPGLLADGGASRCSSSKLFDDHWNTQVVVWGSRKSLTWSMPLHHIEFSGNAKQPSLLTTHQLGKWLDWICTI